MCTKQARGRECVQHQLLGVRHVFLAHFYGSRTFMSNMVELTAEFEAEVGAFALNIDAAACGRPPVNVRWARDRAAAPGDVFFFVRGHLLPLAANGCPATTICFRAPPQTTTRRRTGGPRAGIWRRRPGSWVGMGRLKVASGYSGPGTTAWRLCGAACLPAARREARRQHGARHGRPRVQGRGAAPIFCLLAPASVPVAPVDPPVGA